jgi:tRNA pseudouridine55 synthase
MNLAILYNSTHIVQQLICYNRIMKNVYVINKPVGETPLSMIQQLKVAKPELQNTPITYAGRLDPLAHGVLVLLADDAIKQKETFLTMQKEYVFEVLLGVQTDTYDYLGLITDMRYIAPPINVNSYVRSFVNNLVGKSEQPYPPYSSKPVEGKPLFQWAREDKLSEIHIPTRTIEVFEATLLSQKNASANSLFEKIIPSIQSVQGDFRQQKVIDTWEKFLRQNNTDAFTTVTISVRCSSGTYVRGIAHALGKELGCGAIALDICRTAVGDYTLIDAILLSKSSTI